MLRRRPCCYVILACALLALLPGAALAAGSQGQAGAIGEDHGLGRLYLAPPASNVVFVMSASTMAVEVILKVPPSPAAIAVDSSRHRVYVASDAAGVISVFDGRTCRLLRTLPVGGHPGGLTLAAGGTALLVTDRVSGALQRVPLTPVPGDPGQIFTAGSSAAPVLVLAPPSGPIGARGAAWSRGFYPGEPVVLYWGVQPLARFRADRSGIGTTSFRVPGGVSLGQHLVIMMGQVSTRSVSTLLTVVPVPRPPKPRRHVPPPPSLLARLLAPRLVLSVPASVAIGPLSKLAGPHPGLAAPAMAVEAAVALLCAALVARSGRGRQRRARVRKEAKAQKGRPRRPRPAGMGLNKATLGRSGSS